MILLGSDHNAIDLKAELAQFLTEQGLECIDLGPHTQTTVDYNVIAQQVAHARRKGDLAILMCGTGVGMSIAANKVPGARAALVHNHMSALKSREHNDSNILCLGSWINSNGVNIALASEWLESKFGEGRHVRRVELIAPEPRNKIVFTNGVFDILHEGHIQMLMWAKSLGERLVVAINSDASTKKLKGPERPINSQENRRSVLSAMRCVDEVLIFDEINPYNLIQTLSPQIVVRGGDFTADEVRIRDGISAEIEVKIFPKVEGFSTTRVIDKARA